MKKLLTFALATTMCAATFSVAACDEGDLPLSGSVDIDALASMTESDWKELSAEANFENVTVCIWGAYVAGDESVKGLGDGMDICVLQIDGNRGYGDIMVDDRKSFLEESELIMVKSLYMETALAMLDNFSDFTYDKECKAFLCNKPIVYEVNVATSGKTVTMTTTNVRVEVLPDGYLGKISCDMKQKLNGADSFEVDVKVIFCI